MAIKIPAIEKKNLSLDTVNTISKINNKKIIRCTWLRNNHYWLASSSLVETFFASSWSKLYAGHCFWTGLNRKHDCIEKTKTETAAIVINLFMSF